MSAVLVDRLSPAELAEKSGRTDGSLYKIVNGQRVELQPISAYAHLIVLRLRFVLSKYLEQNPIGTAIHGHRSLSMKRASSSGVRTLLFWDRSLEF